MPRPEQSHKRVSCTLLLTALLLCSATWAASSDAQIERDVMAVLDEFIVTFSAQDPVGHTATYHFPHYRLARGEMSELPTREAAIEQHRELFKNLPATGWAKSVWVERRIVTMSEQKVHVATQFRRLRADGSEIGTYDSLYVLIKRDGRWGIKLRSSYI